ncbi:hypothetical protein [Sphingobium sp.]|uniref:hypothetical protein n=1 Tax=Sphingobium sp. TaxID=1912891 RepID=UPI002D80A4E0|nr:hypothetical protein [Sphingobium sp.]
MDSEKQVGDSTADSVGHDCFETIAYCIPAIACRLALPFSQRHKSVPQSEQRLRAAKGKVRMAMLDANRIEAFLRHQLDMFNQGRRDDFIAAYREIAPGGLLIDDPVGSDRQEGLQLIGKLFDRYVGWKLTFVELIVNGHEAAACVRNEGVVNGHPVTVHSLETYHFGEGGTFLARYFHPAMSA